MASTRLTGAPEGGVRICYPYPTCTLVPPSTDQGSLARDTIEYGETGWNGEFYVDHVDTSGTTVDGIFQMRVGSFSYKVGYYSALGFQAQAHSPIQGSIPWGTNSYYASKLAALVNPNRQVVSIPTAIFELKDLPALVRDAGTNYIRALGDANLRFSFGVLPMVRDFVALLNFNESVERRIAELNGYASSTKIRKRNLGGGTIEGSAGGATWFSGASNARLGVTGRFQTDYRVWGYCNISVPASFKALLSDSTRIRNAARAAVGGLRLDAFTVWQSLPWSWLVDWFVNVGDFLEANRGGVPTEVSGIRICQSTVTRTTWTVVDSYSPDLLGRQFHTIRSTKRRRVVSTYLPGARPPLLTQGQIGILASIGLVGAAPSYLR